MCQQLNYDTMTPGKEEQLERLLRVEKMSPSFGVTLIKEGGEGRNRIVRWRWRLVAEMGSDRGLSIHKGSSRMSLGLSSGEMG